MATGPICVYPDNPHWFSYKGKPILLITSAEHYSAVVNRDFDYLAYLDVLHAYGLNYTRIYPGAYIEPDGLFAGITNNPLAPHGQQLLVPWARSTQSGYIGGGNLFDLDTWDPAYFERLHAFVSAAEERGIIVEICLYNCQYPKTWPYCPMQAGNNIQRVGQCSYADVQGFADQRLLEYQKKYVDKITREVNAADNVILEIIDEPTQYLADSRVIVKWIDAMADTIVAAEKQLGRRHLIAQQLEIGVDYTCDPRIDVITCQGTRLSKRQIGGLLGLAGEYARNKPIELNETAWLPYGYLGDQVVASRVEMWEFVVGGGAGFNQLNGYFTVDNPAGKHEINDAILRQMSAFVSFMGSLDLVRMTRDTTLIARIDRLDTHRAVLSEKGRQYLAYFHHSLDYTRNYGGSTVYVANPGSYTERLTLDLPEGSYFVAWINPQDCTVISTSEVAHTGGVLQLASPVYAIDIALRILARNQGS